MSSIAEATSTTPIPGAQAGRTAPLNIAHVGDSMEMGGAEKLTATLCRLQRDRGHTASVHCLYRLGVLGEELRAEGFEVVLHYPSAFFHLMRSLYKSFKTLSSRCRALPQRYGCHHRSSSCSSRRSEDSHSDPAWLGQASLPDSS